MPKKFTVTWTAPANDGGDPITDYDIGYTPNGGSETVVAHGSTTPPHELAGLTDGVTYSVRVRAVNSIGDGEWSSPVTQIAALLPGTPTGLSLTAQTESLDLSWTAPAANGGSPITGYSVRYTPSGGSASTVNTGGTGTTYTLSGLTGGTQYSVEVAAITAAGTGAYSSAAAETPAAAVVASTEWLLNFNNTLADSGPNGYATTDGGSSYSSSTVKFGSHSRSYVPYSPDTSTNGVTQTFNSDDFTIEMFVNLDPSAMASLYGIGLFEMLDDTFTNGDMIALYIDAYGSPGYSLNAYFGLESASASTYLNSGAAFPADNTWHHVALVREGTVISLYLDGNRVATSTQAWHADTFIGSSYYWMMSGGYSFGYDGLDGFIDDFRVSSSALYSGTTYTVPTSELT